MPEQPQPLIVVYDETNTTVLSSARTATATMTQLVETDGEDENAMNIMVAAPINAVRVELQIDWAITVVKDGGLGNPGQVRNNFTPTGVTRTGTSNIVWPGNNASGSGSFAYSYTLDNPAGDWPFDADAVELAGVPPQGGMRFRAFTNLGTGGSQSVLTVITFTVTEIELDDGTIYDPNSPLTASLTRWLRVQAGQQAAFGTAVEPDFMLPVVFAYQQGDVEQLAQWDSGTWTALEIVELVASFATFTLRGALFYELLPVLLNAGFGAMTPSGMGPYSYAGSGGPDAVGEPSPYTFRLGGNQGGGGSMVQIADAYCEALALSFNLNTRIVTFESRWFGRAIDDNGGFGYAPAAVALPTGLAMVNGLLATVGLQDAGDTGGAFDNLTALDCALIEWQLQVETGLRPTWAADKNALTYCGVRHEQPRAVWTPHLRTTAANYALVLTKAQQRAYQELQLALSGTDRALTLQLTGRFVGKLNAHERTRGEVVMKPTFVVQTSHVQVTTPHWMDWAITAGWEHGA